MMQNDSIAKVTTLQNIVFDLNDDSLRPLLFNEEEKNYINTFTYINIFCYNLWKALTNCKNYYLEASLIGNGTFNIFYLDNNFKLIYSDSFHINTNFDKLYTFPLKIECDYIYISWDKEQILPSNICFKANNHTLNDVKLLLVVPTYKRVKELEEIVYLYKDLIANLKDLKINSTLLIINNNDFELKYDSNNILVENTKSNIGGSASFIRGAKFAVKYDYSHVIFMDDDAKPLAESLIRTYYLLKNLNSNFSDSFIAGSMFIKNDPFYLYAYAEYIDNEYKIQPYRCFQENISSKDSLKKFLYSISSQLKYNIHNCYRYAGWWYCCIPSMNFKNGEFPIDLFFNGDDIEYSIRIKPKFIALNGICTWHPSFTQKKSIIRHYFSSRNKIIIQNIHFQFNLRHFLKYAFKKFYQTIFQNKLNAYIDLIAMSEGLTSRSTKYNNLTHIEQILGFDIFSDINSYTKLKFFQKISAFKYLITIMNRLFKI